MRSRRGVEWWSAARALMLAPGRTQTSDSPACSTDCAALCWAHQELYSIRAFTTISRLIAFFAWVGPRIRRPVVSCYGPEQAFLTLGTAPAPRALPRRRHGGDRVPDLGLVQPDHRAVPERRRRLPGGDASCSDRSPASSRAERWWWTTCSPSRSRSPRAATRSSRSCHPDARVQAASGVHRRGRAHRAQPARRARSRC